MFQPQNASGKISNPSPPNTSKIHLYPQIKNLPFIQTIEILKKNLRIQEYVVIKALNKDWTTEEIFSYQSDFISIDISVDEEIYRNNTQFQA